MPAVYSPCGVILLAYEQGILGRVALAGEQNGTRDEISRDMLRSQTLSSRRHRQIPAREG